KKIYIAEYPTVQSAQGRRKPGAYQAIIDQINDGVLVVNFIGHGNPTVWTHEAVFSVATSIPQLVNSNKFSVFMLATCNFSQFDDPKRYSGSELLINKPDGGAIGALSATRKVYSDRNAYLHQQVFANMFRRDQYGRLIVERPAAALTLFKFLIGNDINDQKYVYLGDPSMKLQYPAGYASIDSVNHQPLSGAPVQMKALARVSVQGTVRDLSNRPDTAFSGKVLLAVNDASRNVIIVNFPTGSNWSYLGAGSTIYRGNNSVSKGKFNATFVVPRDIQYADSTNKGRLVAYFMDSLRVYEGAGYTENVWVGGTENVTPDTAGPAMTLYLDSRGFRPGDMVGEEPTLLVDLVDSNGINTSVSGIGHRIEAWVNGGSQSRDITDYYQSQLDDYQKGTVQYKLKALAQGRNSVRVRAWDTHNNSSAKETFFEVTSTEQLRISDVFNYPNPFASGTTFTFRQNLLAPLNVTVKIYTLAGRLIQSLETISASDPFVRIAWDGRDRDGDILANGVYLYKVIVRTTDGQYGSEVLGKLSVLK
ncbi:MAG: type IX secretion system sortase PorU, partial [Bacteroidota bacterium]